MDLMDLFCFMMILVMTSILTGEFTDRVAFHVPANLSIAIRKCPLKIHASRMTRGNIYICISISIMRPNCITSYVYKNCI